MDPHPPPCERVPGEPNISVSVRSTTGTRFQLSVPADETVDGLKRRLSQRLNVSRERLALLHRETRLSSGKLLDLGIRDGSKLTLVPTVEAGLMSQASRRELSVLQALESLTETQVSDFLSGRSPLTLALRVGDHMMFVQLQLQHQRLVSRGGSEVITGPSRSERSRVSHHHPQHHPNTTVSSDPAFGPSVPISPTSASGRCSPPPHPSPHPGGFLHSQPSSFSCPRSQNNPAVSSPQINCPAKTSGAAPSPAGKPGAVIESFVNHGPGVFSGTFSGSLHPNCQDGTGRPRRDVGTILQILNDLLSATRHCQGVPPSLAQLRYQTQCSSPAPSPPHTPPLSGLPASAPGPATQSDLHPLLQSQIHMCKPTGDGPRQTENRATRCKLERLQLLMQQKRLRRKARRDSRAPYHWLANRKAGRSRSSSSASSDGSLDLDFQDSVWKPDVKADIKSEFIMA